MRTHVVTLYLEASEEVLSQLDFEAVRASLVRGLGSVFVSTETNELGLLEATICIPNKRIVEEA